MAAGDAAHGARRLQVEARDLVRDEARGPVARRQQGARAGEGVAEGSTRAGGVDDRADRPDRQPQGQPRAVRRRVELGAAGRVRAVLRQHQGLSEQREVALMKMLVAATCAAAFGLGALVASADDPAKDWPMWGGTPNRNMASTAKGLPTAWDVKTKKNIKWVAELGSQTYGNTVVANGYVMVGTNN